MSDEVEINGRDRSNGMRLLEGRTYNHTSLAAALVVVLGGGLVVMMVVEKVCQLVVNLVACIVENHGKGAEEGSVKE